MRKTILVISLLIFILNDTTANTIDSLLVRLDASLTNKNKYVALKEDNLLMLKDSLAIEKDLDKQYLIVESIILQYQSYMCDSALTYVDKNILIAEKLNNEVYMVKTLLRKSFILSLSGLFTESQNILHSIDIEQLRPKLLKDYYVANIRFYTNLLKYTDSSSYMIDYKNAIINYRDSLLSILPNESVEYKIKLASNYYDRGEYVKALNLFLECRTNYLQEDHMYAMLSARIAYTYEALNNIELFKENILIAAITDIELSIKEYEALFNLAIILNREGDQERAYKYIKICMDDANFYNSRFRSSIISRAQPIIEKSYLSQIQNQSENLKSYSIFISILVISLTMALIYIYVLMKAVLKVKKNLYHQNHTLNTLNKNLDESNRIKEEYLGYFINQCSIYIDDFIEYKKIINRKIATGQIDELNKLISSNKNEEKVIQELYKNFDAVFLKLYPNFVNEFNNLLKDDEKYILKENSLNTELRIFALIRLGISDSNQISSFLRYSVRTIYNYRSKVKGKSLLRGDEFEDRILRIGSF